MYRKDYIYSWSSLFCIRAKSRRCEVDLTSTKLSQVAKALSLTGIKSSEVAKALSLTGIKLIQVAKALSLTGIKLSQVANINLTGV